MTKLKRIAPIIFLTILFGFIFFYRLDYNTLASWDEAWYGSIARQIIRSGDFLKMVWNGKPYYDHPPMGFWLMAISYKILGINELSTRLPSVILGLAAIVFVYLTGTELFGKKLIGFASALIIGTSVWYVIRVRSGNLDSVFIFFYILTVYLSIKSGKNFRLFPLTMLAFGGLILAKTLVGFSAVILIIYFNWKQMFKIKNSLLITVSLAGFFLLVYPWYYVQNKTYSDFIQHHFFNIGTRNKSFTSYFHPIFNLPLFYLHMGVRKWYYIWLAALVFLGLGLKFLKKNVFFLFLWNFLILYPFLTSQQTELWHLIPVYLPLSFIIAVGVDEIMKIAIQILKVPFKINQRNSEIIHRTFDFFYLTIFLYISFVQIKTFYKEVFPDNKWIPDDVAISKASAKYKKPIFLDDDYTPIAVFYSGSNVQPIAYLPDDQKTLAKFMESGQKNFVVITRNWVVDDLKNKGISFKLLEKNSSFSILTSP